MRHGTVLRVIFSLLGILLSASTFARSAVTCTSPAPLPGNAQYEYFVSVAEHDRHQLHVAIRYGAKQATLFQMPVWNALYQVRDFAQYVTELHAHDGNGKEINIQAEGKSAWRVSAAEGCSIVEYNLYANSPGPFSAQANSEHVFLNWAQVLLYGDRTSPIMVAVSDVPNSWTLHDLGLFDEAARHLERTVTYDALVDSPVEISPSKISVFAQDGAHYRIVVDAEDADYNLPAIQEALRKVVHASVDWMHDRPFDQYTFLFHFPHGPVGGGMEHSYGTAISAPADRMHENGLAPIGTSAHEFFHLWNVKRIRPQSLEPVDFQQEQYTRALWFAEGVTSTASELMLVRAGLENERGYLAHLSAVISDFESRPAHKFQSAEASSLQAWMEGRPYYRRPDRSVSYYASGELLGVMLDLEMRKRTKGAKSLRDLFVYLNAEYAKQHRNYDDSSAIQQAAEKIAGGSFQEFFDKYVRGTEAIPYDDFLHFVGLTLQPFAILGVDAGFDASVNFSGLPEVTKVTPGSAVEAAGVRAGDTLTAIDDREYMGDLSNYLTGHKPGETVTFRFASRTRTMAVKVTLKESTGPAFSVVEVPTASVEQRIQRTAWIHGDDIVREGRP